MVTGVNNSQGDSEVGIKQLILGIQDLLISLLKRWRIFLIVIVLGGAIGLAYSFLEVPLYTATTTFVVENGDSRGGLSRYSGVAALAGIDLGGNSGSLFQGDNILELYRSRIMLTQALLSKTYSDSSELLIERYIDFENLKDNWKGDPDLLSLDFKQDPSEMSEKNLRLRNRVISSIVNNINEDVLVVQRLDKQVSIIQVDVTTPDEIFSKSFNENLVSRVSEFYVKTKTKKPAENISIIQSKIDSVMAVMRNSIYSAVQISDATPNLNPTRQVKRIAPAQEAQFSAESNKALLGQLTQNLEITKMTLLQEQPLIQLVDAPVYPLPKIYLSKVKGIVIGSFIFGFFTLLFFILQKWYRDVIEGD